MRICHQGLIPTHHRSIKTRFTCRFLWALKNLNKNQKTFSYHKVKVAAYSSLASAVGPTRTWSRVLLRRIQNRQRSRASVLLRRRRRTRREYIYKKKVLSTNDEDDEDDEAIGKLRELVPGGDVMGFSRLLDESAHYIKCLNMQVQIMRNIAHHLSV